MSQAHKALARVLFAGAVVFFSGLISLSVPAACAQSGQDAKVTFRRVFQGSSPEFIELTVRDNSNSATYDIRQLDEDASAAPFEVSDSLRAKIFALAGELNHFQGQDLDVHRKIANLGEKTFRWEQGAVTHETKFNYRQISSQGHLLRILKGF